MENKPTIIPKEIRNLIYNIRSKQVMLDSDLASLYQVETKNLNKAVKRNIERFPEKFCFQLTDEEADFLRFQIGTSNVRRGGRRQAVKKVLFSKETACRMNLYTLIRCF
ncbi:ORF6N domain-containing protein [Sphingobacterium kyonggiense]